MTSVFADAHYYIALLNDTDRHHAAAFQAAKSRRRPYVTTIWVLMEVADALAAPSFRAKTHQFLQGVLTHPTTTVVADVEPWFSRGLALYGSRPDKGWSLTDCISFVVMKERGIGEALTGDRHFVQAGFQALLAGDAAS